MSDLRIVVPARLVQQLEARQIPRAMIRKTVTENVIRTLEELADKAPAREPKSGETANEYFRRIMLERNGGKPPSLDEPYVKGYTRGQWFALSDQERQALWDKWHKQAEKEIDKEYGEGIDVRIENLAGQERRHKNLARAREKRAGYRTRRRGTKRA